MPSEATSEPKFKIGHVLFIDIVGYSKLLLDEQNDKHPDRELSRPANGPDRR